MVRVTSNRYGPVHAETWPIARTRQHSAAVVIFGLEPNGTAADGRSEGDYWLTDNSARVSGQAPAPRLGSIQRPTDRDEFMPIENTLHGKQMLIDMGRVVISNHNVMVR